MCRGKKAVSSLFAIDDHKLLLEAKESQLLDNFVATIVPDGFKQSTR